MNYTTIPENIYNTTISFSSDNEDVAYVDEGGYLHMTGGGNTIIHVRVNKNANEVIEKQILVFVESPAQSIDIDDVAKGISDKLVHRHPHVFGNTKVNGTEDILANWDKLKAEEKKHRKSAMDGISKAQSALMSAQKISKNAVKKGFEWPDEEALWDCFESETLEFKQAVAKNDKQNAEEELGDILFAAVNLARWNKIDAEQALLKANRKFAARFRKMEEIAAQNPDKPMETYTFEEYDKLWKQAKKEVKNQNIS